MEKGTDATGALAATVAAAGKNAEHVKPDRGGQLLGAKRSGSRMVDQPLPVYPVNGQGKQLGAFRPSELSVPY
jgi:hypothetical protein